MTWLIDKFLTVQPQLARFAQATGIIAYAGLQWLILLRLLPIGGYELVGSYALAQAVVAPVVGFFAFSLRPLWVSGALGELSAGSVLAVRITTGMVALTMAIVITLTFQIRLDAMIFTYVLASKFLDMVSDILAAIFDRQGKSAISGLLLIMKSALLSLVILAGWTAQFDLSTIVSTLVIVQACIVIAEWKLSGSARPFGLFKFSQWLAVIPLATALFAAVNSLVASVAGFLPRYLLELFADRETVGYFSTIFIPVLMIQMIATGLSQTHLHQLSRVARLGEIRQTFLASAPVAMLIVGLHMAITILVFLAAAFVDWGWENQRSLLHDVAFVLVLSLPLGLRQFYSYLAMSTGRMTAIFTTSAILLAVQALLAPWAIQTEGIFGCVILMSAGAVVQIGTYLWILRKPVQPMAEYQHG
ncbi:hypothetical protein [Rhizorhapis sp. SPR117]|uniref:hypothetical protein n=1 Tax=Rhizorhapis sp. SPR117 TaxID=2912611 RepID=UPI001F237775|nr:hypothetical protein [Rhizorhapis sp. SPR117]